MNIVFDNINIVLTVTAALNLFLGFVIFFNGHNRKINIVYSLNIIVIVAWVLAMVFYRSAPEAASPFWASVLYATPTLIAGSFLYFTYIFPASRDKNVPLKTFVIFLITAAAAGIALWPELMIKAVNVRPGLEKEILFTRYYWAYFVYTLAFFSYGFHRLYVKYLKETGIERTQVIYLLVGYALAANIAFATNLLLPWVGYFEFNWLGPICTITMVGFTAYAILRYRLMDIRVVARKVFIYLGIGSFVYGVFYLLTWFYDSVLGGAFTRGAYISGLIVAPIFVAGFYIVDRAMRMFANKYLFVSLYNYQETINHLTEELNNYIELGKIVNLIVDTIKRTMQLNRAGVLLVNMETDPVRYQIAKVIGFNENNGISLVKDNFLTKYLLRTMRPLVSDELTLIARDAESEKDRQGFVSLYKMMSHIEASLCLPLVSNKKLIGIIVLGSKMSGDAYTKEDLNLLNTLSKQAGIAIDNARLYEAAKKFNTKRKREVKKATVDLQKANEQLKHADQMKSEFLSIAAHQLRTPLTGIKGYVSMFLEGDYGRITAKQRAGLDVVARSSDRLVRLVNVFLNVSRIETGHLEINREPVQLDKVVADVIADLKNQADNKGLDLRFQRPDKSLPAILLDRDKMQDVIMNLVDNSVKYTKSGWVNVRLSASKSLVTFEVSDSGIGIDPAEIDKLFQKFSRAEAVTRIHTGGSGLGLFIAKKIIEAHGGRIWAESPGEGKGSIFAFSLPLSAKPELNVQVHEHNVQVHEHN